MTKSLQDRRIHREIHGLNSGSDPFAAAMRATHMPMLITDPRQPDNPIVFVNDAFAKLTGYSREETLGKNCRFLQGPGTNLEDVAKVREAIARRQPVEIELLNYRKDGSLFWNRLLISPVFNGGELSYFFASQFDITRDRTAGIAADRDEIERDLQRRIADLTASEERLHFTLKAGGLGTWTLDVPSQRLVASPICKANFGRDAADNFTYQDLAASIHPDDVARWAQTVDQALSGDGELHVEYRAIWPDGSIHWIEIRAQTKFNDDGSPSLMSGVSIDITDRKETDELRALLNQELAHRIKKMLATVQTVVLQSLRDDGRSDDVAKTVSERIAALSRSQDVLTGKNLSKAGLVETVRRAVEPFNGDNRIQIDGPDVPLPQDLSRALIMALHELSTNAIKYGALSNGVGTVEISWTVTNGSIDFRWAERGGPLVSPPTRKGFGSRMIEKALSATVRGTAAVDYRPKGVVFKMRAELGELG